MKILYHHRTLGDGAEAIHIHEMVMALRSLGHDVKVCALKVQQSSATGQTRDWSMITSRFPRVFYEFAEISYNLLGRKMISQAIKEFCPDVIYDRYNSYSTAAIKVAQKVSKPLLLEVNAPLSLERTQEVKNRVRFKKLLERYERWILHNSDHIVAVSTPLKEFLCTERGVRSQDVSVLPNGVNVENFNPRKDGTDVRRRYGIRSECQVLGFVGILRRWHGIDLLLSAFGKLARAGRNLLHLLIVGDGPLEAELKSTATNLGIADRVTFTGRVPHGEIQEHLAAMDIAVSPRATFYASPMKILEYMAMELPVVAPRMPNIVDIIKDDFDGVLFDPEDVDSMSCVIDRLLQDDAKCQQIGQQARQSVETRLNWENNARRVVDIFSELTGDQAVDHSHRQVC